MVCAVLVHCLGLSLKAVINGTFAKLIYKKDGEKFYSIVQSEKPLTVIPFRSVPARGKGSVVVCSTMYGHPAKFNHWLKYQETLSIDSVHLNSDSTFLENSSGMYPFLDESLNNGFVNVEVWKNIAGNQRMYYYGQVTKYQDCIYRNINLFDYVLIYDYDDYFNPVIPNRKDIHYYTDKFFSKSSTGTVHIPWQQMKCRPIEEKCQTLQDGNLTSILSGYNSSMRSERKCAHRLNSVAFLAIHSSQVLLPSFTRIRSSDKLAYVAHNCYNNTLCTS